MSLGVFFLRMTDPLDRFGLYRRTVFIWQIIQGWLAAPLIFTCSLVFSSARQTPILAGGIGVARLVAGAFFVFFVVCLFVCGQVNVSTFACNAIRLDPVQRLEQKNDNTQCTLTELISHITHLII